MSVLYLELPEKQKINIHTPNVISKFINQIRLFCFLLKSLIMSIFGSLFMTYDTIQEQVLTLSNAD